MRIIMRFVGNEWDILFDNQNKYFLYKKIQFLMNKGDLWIIKNKCFAKNLKYKCHGKTLKKEFK